jgi:SAM-dependent methyltransferase
MTRKSDIFTGTGLLTRSLCGVLESRDDVIVEYVVSDISFALANATVKSLPYLRACPKAYDLCRPPEEQGLLPCSFDLIVGLDVIHAVPDISNVLKFLHRVLIPGGSLLVVELDGTDWKSIPSALWADVVFGGFSEWFGYADGRDHPSISPNDWGHLVRSAGFVDFQQSREIGGGREFFFAAQKSFSEDSSFDITNLHFLTYTFGKEIELQQQFKNFDINQSISLWIFATNGIDGDAAQGLVKTLCCEYINWSIRLGIFDKETDESSRVDWVLANLHCLANDTIIHFSRDGLACVPRVMPSAPPSNRFDPATSSWRSTSFGLVQSHLPSLGDQELLVDICCWSESVSSYRGFSGTVVQSKCLMFKSGQRVVGLVRHQEVSNRLICSAGSVMAFGANEETDVLTEYALTSAIVTLILGPMRAAGGVPDKPPLKVLLADEGVITSKLWKFCLTIPFLIQAQTSVDDDDEVFDLILTSSKELSERPEIGLWRGPIFVWDDSLHEMTHRNPWVLGQLVKTSLRLTKVDRSLSQSPLVISPREIYQTPALLDQREAPLFSSSKAYLLVGGMSDLGVHLALWMYQVGGSHKFRAMVIEIKCFTAWCKTNYFNLPSWSQIP